MEGQQNNPMSGPAPQPEAQPQPAPQESFAEPIQASAGWQPAQATAPQVGGLNIPPALAASAPAPKKSHAGVIIGIIVGLLVIVGAIIAIVLLAGQSGTTTDSNGNNGGDGGKSSGKTESSSDEKLKMRNIDRSSSLAHYLVMIKDYQVNHSGKTPFGTKYDQTVLGLFVNRYIDDGISESGAAEGKAFSCNKGSCVMFTDVDGTALGWTVDVAVNGKTDESISYKNEGKPDHILHVYVKSLCGDVEGTYTSTGRETDYSIFYFVEGGIILCGDSENGVVNPIELEIPTDDSEQSSSARDIQREDDTARFLTAMNDYMTNNSGKTPFGTTSEVKTDYSGFVTRYIDSDVTVAKNGTTTCASGKNCKRFKDPDGTLYTFYAMKLKDWEAVRANKNSLDHVMYVVINAGCEDYKSGKLRAGTGDRQIAMLYVLENGSIACNDNH